MASHNRANFYRDAWQEAAQSLGATMTCLGSDIYEIRRGEDCVRVSKNYTPLDDPVTLAIAGDKPLVYRLLAARHLPVPRHAHFTLDTLDEAKTFLDETRRDCVVKPAKDTGGGAGVTTGVRTKYYLALAAATAAVHGREILIEEQIEGETYRLLYLDGTLLDAVLRSAPAVVGDGRSTMAELLEQANAERRRRGSEVGQVLITPDLDMRLTLEQQGLRLNSIPVEGQTVRVKTVANDNGGLDNHAARHVVCDSIVESGAIAAMAVGARLAGVDVMTPNPALPLRDSGGVILEVNTTPGYYYHYHRRGGGTPVAIDILNTLFRTNDYAHRATAVTESLL